MLKKQLSGAGSPLDYRMPPQAHGTDTGRRIGEFIATSFRSLKRAFVWYGDTMRYWATGGRFPE